jgi:hypothetical protein
MCRIVFGLMVMGLSWGPVAVGQDIILLDTYQDDVIGNPPNGPEIGSYVQLVGTHMVDDFGGGDLKVLSSAQVGDGWVINMRPVADSPLVRTTFEYLVFGNSNLSGLNALSQQWILRPIGNNLSLYWADNHLLHVWISRADGSNELINTGYDWGFDREYQVEVLVDATTDTFTIQVDGNDVLVDHSFGADLSYLWGLAFSTNTTSAALRVLNDVKMENEVCQTDSTPPLAELDTPPHLGTGCTCSNPKIIGTADDPEVGLGEYVLEYRPASGGVWTQFASGTSPVIGGVLGVWPTNSLTEGYYTVRLTVTNACGLSSTDVRTIFLDKQFSSLELRWPEDGDIVGRRVCLDGTAFDSWCFDSYVAEYRPAGGGAWLPVDPGNPVYNSSVVNDPFAIWETLELGIPDGDYDLRVVGETECGNSDEVMATVAVDNTPPTSIISSVVNCDVLDGVVAIEGTAWDVHLDTWYLQYIGGSAVTWTTIATGTTAVADDVLANWDTTGLMPCAYVLRLRVTDDSVLQCGDTRFYSDAYATVTVGEVCDGDLDHDGDVDVIDYDLFVQSFTGPMP